MRSIVEFLGSIKVEVIAIILLAAGLVVYGRIRQGK